MDNVSIGRKRDDRYSYRAGASYAPPAARPAGARQPRGQVHKPRGQGHQPYGQVGVLEGAQGSHRRTSPVILALLPVFALACLAFGCKAAAPLARLWNESPIQAAGAALPPSAAAPTVIPTDPAMASALLSAKPLEGRTSFLVLGSDQRPDDPGYRTDVFMLVTVDPAAGKVSVVSFPRDLWVEVPDLYPMKINMVQGLGGFESTAGMFEKNFGVRPAHYVMTNFEGVVKIVDSLGGIDVNAAVPLTDQCDLPWGQDGACSVGPGIVHLDGASALWYIRSRHSTSDYDRLRRAQEVLWGIYAKIMTAGGAARLPELYAAWQSLVETDMSLADMASLAPVAAQMFKDSSPVSRYVIDEAEASPFWTGDGMWALWPDLNAIGSIVSQAVETP